MNRLFVLLTLSSFLAVGCGAKEKSPEKPKPESNVEKAKGKSAQQVLTEGFTGKAAVQGHRRAKKEVTEARKKRDKELDEVFEGM